MGFNADFVSGKDVQMDQDSVMGIITQSPESTQSSLNWTAAGEKLYGVPFIIEGKIATGSSTLTLINANNPWPFIIIDFWTVNYAAGGAADTAKLTDGTNDITDALDCNKADTTVTRCATINDAYYKIAKDGTLNLVTASGAPVNAFVLCMRVPN